LHKDGQLAFMEFLLWLCGIIHQRVEWARYWHIRDHLPLKVLRIELMMGIFILKDNLLLPPISLL
jgi:hypothetical protein